MTAWSRASLKPSRMQRAPARSATARFSSPTWNRSFVSVPAKPATTHFKRMPPMKKLMLSFFAAVVLLAGAGLHSPAMASEAMEAVTLAQATVETAAPAVAAAEPAAEVHKGDVAWMMVSTILVIFMVIPGLALFYGGLVRSKNMLSVLMQVFTVFSLIVVLWALYGYSLAFTGTGAFFGSFEKLFLNGVTLESLADTFT